MDVTRHKDSRSVRGYIWQAHQFMATPTSRFCD